MAFIRKKTKGSGAYYQLVESRREDGRVVQKVLKHLGSKEQADAYASEHGIGTPQAQKEYRFDSSSSSSNSPSRKSILVLADGSFFVGTGFGAEKEQLGELVFNTGMTGYQEAVTDPSYRGQILTFCYPLQGNYGTNEEDLESGKVHVQGVVAAQACPANTYSHYKSGNSFGEFLASFGVPGISGVDTRAIVMKVREKGVMPSAISPLDADATGSRITELVHSLKSKINSFDYGAQNFFGEVSVGEKKLFKAKGAKKRVALIDCGVKMSIVRELVKRKIDVSLLPYDSTPKDILAEEPGGVMFSNGPGDPIQAREAVAAARHFMGKLPVFGICLGNQILGMALGAKTYKLKFGHRGANHAVKNLETGRVYISSHNHGYSVDARTLPREVAPLFEDCNDKTNEGLRHKDIPFFSCQFHPEGNAGPQDTGYLFDDFVKLL